MASPLFDGLNPKLAAIIAFSIGLASFLNAKLVMRFGMRSLVSRSLQVILGLAVTAIGITLFAAGQLPLWFLMGYLMLTFFFVGILFGNNNALAMQPLGQIAGIGAAVVGSFSTFIAVSLGSLIGQSYNGTILPLIIGIAALSALSLLVVRWVEAS